MIPLLFTAWLPAFVIQASDKDTTSIAFCKEELVLLLIEEEDEFWAMPDAARRTSAVASKNARVIDRVPTEVVRC